MPLHSSPQSPDTPPRLSFLSPLEVNEVITTSQPFGCGGDGDCSNCQCSIQREEAMGGPVDIPGDQLRAIVERIEHIEQEISELNDSKREI